MSDDEYFSCVGSKIIIENRSKSSFFYRGMSHNDIYDSRGKNGIIPIIIKPQHEMKDKNL